MKRPAPGEPERKTTQIVRDEPKDGPRPEKRAKAQPAPGLTGVWDELIKPQPTAKDNHIKQIQELLKEAFQQFRALDIETTNTMIEVELRLGRAKSNAFNAGVHESSFSRIKDYLESKDQEWNCFGTKSTEFHYNSTIGEGSWRVSVDGDSQQDYQRGPRRDEASCHLKVKEKDANLTFNNQEHDARIGISKEIVQDEVPSAIELEKFRLRRDKNRLSFENTTTNVRVDLTQVTTHQPTSGYVHGNTNQSRGVVSYEVEIEVCQARWFEMSAHVNAGTPLDLEVNTLAVYLYDLLIEFLTLIKIDPNTTVPLPSAFPDVKMAHETGQDKLLALKQHVVKAFSSLDTTVGGDFPGSMPVTFSRRHYGIVKNGDYMFSEKTDGLRYLLLMCETGFYLIDRKYAFFKLLECQALVQNFVFQTAEPQITLLDGELVRNEDTKKVFFLIFDIIQFYGESVANLNLNARLAKVSKIVESFRALDGKGGLQTPFVLIAKAFSPNIGSIFANITERKDKGKDEIHRYFNDKSKRHHKTDGIIMTPNEPYRMKTVDNLFKWKYPDLQSIDFRAKHLGQGNFSLSMSVEGGEAECIQTKFLPHDFAKLKADMATYQKHLDAIVELVYDTHRGCWRYHTIRPDKKTPNFVRIVFDTMAIIAENVTPRELIEVLAKKIITSRRT